MDIRNRSAIRQAADRALAEAPGNPKRVVLVFAGASSLLALLVTLISFALSSQISNTGGLHNFGLRSMLSTGQSILPLVQMLLMLCWNMGYAVCALRMSRRQEAEPAEEHDHELQIQLRGQHVGGDELRQPARHGLRQIVSYRLSFAVGLVHVNSHISPQYLR